MNRPVRSWDLQLGLESSAAGPLFLRISRAIAADIQRGRLRAGARLPGTRTLARSLAVHRNTVIAAYQELFSEGWIESSPARGTFVARSVPVLRPRSAGPRAIAGTRPTRAGFELRGAALRPEPPTPSSLLAMSGGIPDVRLVPVDELARAYRRALREHGTAVLSYSEPQGHPRLRAALAEMLAASRGLATSADDVLITAGSQMALELVARVLVEPGDVVAVEALGYRYAWEVFRQHGAKLVPVPVDGEGMDVDALRSIAGRTPVRAVYVTPHHQYPTTVTMTASRRIALLELAERMKIALIEDDYDHEFHYEGRPVLPLARADRAGVVVYIGTLSKILAPGVRLGYLVAPTALLERAAWHRVYLDRHGDYAVELAVAQLLEQGTVQRHARRARRVYLARRDLLAAELRRRFGDALAFRVPSGGMAIWAEAHGIDCERWAEEALRRGVIIHPAKRFAFDGRPRPCVRLGFAALDERELLAAVRRLQEARRNLRAGSVPAEGRKG